MACIIRAVRGAKPGSTRWLYSARAQSSRPLTATISSFEATPPRSSPAAPVAAATASSVATTGLAGEPMAPVGYVNSAAAASLPHNKGSPPTAPPTSAPVWERPEVVQRVVQPGGGSGHLPLETAGTMVTGSAFVADDRAAAMQQEQLGLLAGAGDLRLAEFMEHVKHELWQYDAMPLRRRFRIQSLLSLRIHVHWPTFVEPDRRLQTPPFETWIDSLVRATDSCTRQFTRTLLARHESIQPLDGVEAPPGFDLLLLCWKPGAASVIHDHPEAGCWVKTLKGQIRETRYAVADADSPVSTPAESRGASAVHISSDKNARQLVESSTVTLSAGSVTYIEDSMGYHKMDNPDPNEECISLHLYSPGITECTTWANPASMSDSVRAFLDCDTSLVAPGAGSGKV